jgi:hypothetical protein
MLAFAYGHDYLEGRCGISLTADHRFFAVAISFTVADRSSGSVYADARSTTQVLKVGSQ